MKVYVETKDIDVINDLFEATSSYECWACNRDDDLEIVSLADYTKQVRKEVCEEIGRKVTMIANRQPNHDIGFDCEDMQISYLEVASVLNQIQGESNAKD